MIELRNETPHEFIDISSELWREYTFVNGAKVRINEPAYLSVDKHGNARILTMAERSIYIPWGWLVLEWQAGEGAPHFIK